MIFIWRNVQCVLWCAFSISSSTYLIMYSFHVNGDGWSWPIVYIFIAFEYIYILSCSPASWLNFLRFRTCERAISHGYYRWFGRLTEYAQWWQSNWYSLNCFITTVCDDGGKRMCVCVCVRWSSNMPQSRCSFPLLARFMAASISRHTWDLWSTIAQCYFLSSKNYFILVLLAYWRQWQQ